MLSWLCHGLCDEDEEIGLELATISEMQSEIIVQNIVKNCIDIVRVSWLQENPAWCKQDPSLAFYSVIKTLTSELLRIIEFSGYKTYCMILRDALA